MKFLFVFAAVFAVAFAQYDGPNESDLVPTTDYPLEPEVSEDEPANNVPVQKAPVKVDEVLPPIPGFISPIPRVTVAPSSTKSPVPVPVVRSDFRYAPPVTYAPTTRFYVPSSVAPVPTSFVKSVAVVSTSDKLAKTTQELNEINPDGQYQYAFSNDNGISQEATGTLRNFGGNPPSQALVVTGAFSWPGLSLKYIADENGYQPQSDALPTPPPVPPQIKRAVEYLARVFAERAQKQ